MAGHLQCGESDGSRDSYRRVILYGEMPHWQYLGAGGGNFLRRPGRRHANFKILETGIADLI